MDSPETQKPNPEAQSISRLVSKWFRFLWGPLLVALSAFIGALVYLFVVQRVGEAQGVDFLVLLALGDVVAYAPVVAFVLSLFILAWIRQQKHFIRVLWALVSVPLIYFAYLSINEPIRKQQVKAYTKKHNVEYEQLRAIGQNAKNVYECARTETVYLLWYDCVKRLVKTASDYTECRAQAPKVNMQTGIIPAEFSPTQYSAALCESVYAEATAKATNNTSPCRELSFAEAQRRCFLIFHADIDKIASSINEYFFNHRLTLPADGMITAGANGNPVLTGGLQSVTLRDLPTIPINAIYYYRHAGTKFIVFTQDSFTQDGDAFWYYRKPDGQSGTIKGQMPTCTAQACP